jgi:hypothetical protein
LPLKSIQYALDWEFRNRIDLIKQVYTDFDVQHKVDEEDIMNYLEEVGGDPDYYFIENEGVPGKEQFFSKNYREMQLNVQQDEKGSFVETEDKNFFKIKPSMLQFEGDVIVDANSILVQSEELEKADTLRMTNILVPVLAEGDPAVIGRTIKQLLLSYNKDPRKWLPDEWLTSIEQKGKIGTASKEKPAEDGVAAKAETVVPQGDLQGSGKTGLGQRMSAAFSSFKDPSQ